MVSTSRSMVVALSFLSGVQGCESSVPRDASPPPGTEWEPALAELFEELEAAVRRDENDAVARGRLGMARHVNRLKGAALTDYRRAAELSRSDPKWCYLAALILADLGRVREAVAEVDRAIERWPTAAHAHWRRGLFLLELGELDRADSSFVRAAALAESDPVPWLGRARVELQRSRPGRAVQHVAEAIRRDTRNLNLAYAHQLLGAAYRQQGRLEEAKEALALGRHGRPFFTDPWVEDLGRYKVTTGARLADASALMSRGEYDEAIRLLETMRGEQPTNVIVLRRLGAACIARGAVARAREVLEHALALEPDDPMVHVNLSRVHLELGELDEALRMADGAAELNPAFPVVHAQRARALHRLGRADEASEAYREALRLAPDATAILLEAAHLAEERERWEEVSDLANAAIHAWPRSLEAHRARARARAALGDDAGAREDLARADELAPTRAESLRPPDARGAR